jgi:hypothetical protein
MTVTGPIHVSIPQTDRQQEQESQTGSAQINEFS